MRSAVTIRAVDCSSSRCPSASGPASTCRCSCGGANHGTQAGAPGRHLPAGPPSPAGAPLGPAPPLPAWRQRLGELRGQLAADGWLLLGGLARTGDVRQWITDAGGPGPAALAQETRLREAGRIVDAQVQRRTRQHLADQPQPASLQAERDRLRHEAAQLNDQLTGLRTPVLQRLARERFGGRDEADLPGRDRLQLRALAAQDADVGPAIRGRLDRLAAISARRAAIEAQLADTEAREARARRTALLEVLAEERPMGATVNGHAWRFIDRPGQASDPQMQALLEQGAQFWPRSWIEASNQLGGVHAGRARRGYSRIYPDGSYDMLVSPKPNSRIPEDAPELPVALHEQAHRMQRAVDGITRFEWAFYRRRTTPPGGDPGLDQTSAQRLDQLQPGLSYGPDELVRPDRFADPYIGKDNTDGGDGGTPGAFYEVFPAGVEGLWTGNYPIDADHRRFVLGLLALLPGNRR
jgi:hypothetical protein